MESSSTTCHIPTTSKKNLHQPLVWLTLVLLMFDILLRLHGFQAGPSFQYMTTIRSATSLVECDCDNVRDQAAANLSGSIFCPTTSPSTASPTAAATDTVSTGKNYNLRFDWSHLPVRSALAKHIQQTQQKCPATTTFFNYTHRANGFGQNIHVWSAALGVAMENSAILISRGPWVWNTVDCNRHIKANLDSESPMWCYFGRHESRPSCPEQIPKPHTRPGDDFSRNLTGWGFKRRIPKVLRKFNATVSDFRAASMEYLFQSVTQPVLQEAQRQVRQAFPQGLPDPANLVTVHVRWGDKKVEMDLAPIEEYIQAVVKLVGQDRAYNTQHPLNIYLTSESPDAKQAFVEAAPKHWIMGSSGPKTPEKDTNIKKFASGEAGLGSLGALLVSLQANYYVLTTKSNWSRLINELRRAVVDSRCEQCTSMVDLIYGEW